MRHAFVSSPIGAVSWGTRMWTAPSSCVGTLGSGSGGWMGRPLKYENAGLWRDAASLMTTGAHLGGAPTCLAMVAMARVIAVSPGTRPGWWTGGSRPSSGVGYCHHRV